MPRSIWNGTITSGYLGAGEDGEAAYRLLHDALARAERVGIGRWTLHNREYLVALRALDEALALHTMRSAEELVEVDSLDLSAPSRKPTKREVEMAATLVESLHDDFTAEAFDDDYRERVLELIEAKAVARSPISPGRPRRPEAWISQRRSRPAWANRLRAPKARAPSRNPPPI